MDPIQILTTEQANSNQTLTPTDPLFYWSASGTTREHQVRRFLKVLLPSIPVIAFSIDFLYTYISQASIDLADDRPIDATHPFFGALLLALVLGLLCIFIYHGVLRILSETRE